MMHHPIGGQVESREPRAPATVVGEVKHPQAPLPVDAQRQHRLKVRHLVGGPLPLIARVCDRAAVFETCNLDGRVAVGVQGEEDTAVGRHGDVAGRIVQIGDHFENAAVEKRLTGAVLEPLAAAEAIAHEAEQYDHEEQQTKNHAW